MGRNERDHHYECPARKQQVDKRDLFAVFHHEEPGPALSVRGASGGLPRMTALLDQFVGFAGQVRFVEIPAVNESRGQLVEFDHRCLPFAPQRTFFVTDVPAGTVRGGHAHKECEQLLICLRGRMTVEVALKENRARVALNRPSLALYLGPGVWAEQRYEASFTELLVFASLPYDSSSYFTDALTN